jgi:transposase
VPEENRIYIDEAGSNLGMSPLRAWAPKGERAYDKKPAQRGSNISIVGALKKSGMAACYPYDGSVDAERFVDFLENRLQPYVQSADVLIMDNCRTHHASLVKHKLKQLSMRVLFLPPYSPELNPIEESWSVIKERLRRKKARNIAEYVEGIIDAKNAIDSTKASGFFKHAASFDNLC